MARRGWRRFSCVIARSLFGPRVVVARPVLQAGGSHFRQASAAGRFRVVQGCYIAGAGWMTGWTMGFLKSPARVRRGVLAGAVALALCGASMSVEARRLDVATPHNWKAGDGTGVAAIFDALRAVPSRKRPAGTMAVTTPVTSCADDGSAGTLRSVVTGANDGDTVDLRGLACGPIVLTQGVIPVYVDTL